MMSENGREPLTGLYIRLGVVAVLVVLASISGFWLGGRSAPFEPERPAPDPASAAPAASPASAAGSEPSPPLYFYFSVPSGPARNAVEEEIAMASAAGIHRYAVSVPLPWDGDMSAFMEPLNFVANADPAASLLVCVTLDPPPVWLAGHPNEACASGVSLASEPWREEARTALGALVSAVNAGLGPGRVQGYMIGCLEGGLWRHGGADTSKANLAGFRKWLKARYADDAQLRKAWADETVTLETAAIPANGTESEGCRVFLELPAMRPCSDFLAYTSETAAARISEFTNLIKQIGGPETDVIATYGYSFEFTDARDGHFCLARLLETDIDGFASPVSYVNRGLGGTGGMMGPVDSALLHGKQWHLIDDTRTGIARNPSTGKITRPRNVRPEDIYSVQQRNFAAALAHRIGLMWSDAEGEGRLHDTGMWRGFGKMASIYSDSRNWPEEKAAAAPSNEPELEEDLQAAQMSELAVVVDEESRFVESCATELNDLLLRQVRDSASQAGLPVRLYLLGDVLSGKAPGAPVYVFLNAFSLGLDERVKLRSLLETNRANAIWMYAPGYFGPDGASAENITQLTGVGVKAFEEPALSGSTYSLAGKWMSEDEEFGARLRLDPLFYIEDENADVLATYIDSKKPSIATRFFEEGWGSVLCAEPSLTPQMLREILSILEVFMCCQPGMQNFYDTFFFGENLMAIHAREPGERTVEFDQTATIEDLLAPGIRWQGRRVINIPLNTGDTRILKVL